MVKAKIIISPPFCNQSYHIKEGEHYSKGSFVTNVNDLIYFVKNNEIEFFQKYEEVVVFGINGTSKEREDILDNLKYIYNKFEKEYLFLDISQEALLYEMFSLENFDILPIYIFYDCLEMPKKVKKIKVPNKFDTLFYNGSAAIIVDIHAFLLNSTGNRIMFNFPSVENVFINEKLCEFLNKLSDLGFLIILSHCENNKYFSINFSECIQIYDILFEKIHFDVCGFVVSLNKSIEERGFKPHPFHFFNIFKEFHIDPKKSVYLGYQEIDEKFAEFAGITKYIDCSIPRKIDKIKVD